MFQEPIPTDAAAVVSRLKAAGLRIATAESLTAGAVAGALACVPGASDALDGGFVVYSYAMKTKLLGVPAELLESRGAVDADVARLMAEGALAAAASADLAVACTGVAGPGPSDGKPQGTVFVALARGNGDTLVREHRFDGDRAAVRLATVSAVLALVLESLDAAD